MAATLDEVLELAKGTHALSQEQLSRILALAPTMDAADLERLKTVILGVRAAETESAKKQLAIYKKAADAQEAWSASTAHEKLKNAEIPEILQDAAHADALINNL